MGKRIGGQEGHGGGVVGPRPQQLQPAHAQRPGDVHPRRAVPGQQGGQAPGVGLQAGPHRPRPGGHQDVADGARPRQQAHRLPAQGAGRGQGPGQVPGHGRAVHGHGQAQGVALNTRGTLHAVPVGTGDAHQVPGGRPGVGALPGRARLAGAPPRRVVEVAGPPGLAGAGDQLTRGVVGEHLAVAHPVGPDALDRREAPGDIVGVGRPPARPVHAGELAGVVVGVGHLPLRGARPDQAPGAVPGQGLGSADVAPRPRPGPCGPALGRGPPGPGRAVARHPAGVVVLPPLGQALAADLPQAAGPVPLVDQRAEGRALHARRPPGVVVGVPDRLPARAREGGAPPRRIPGPAAHHDPAAAVLHQAARPVVDQLDGAAGPVHVQAPPLPAPGRRDLPPVGPAGPQPLHLARRVVAPLQALPGVVLLPDLAPGRVVAGVPALLLRLARRGNAPRRGPPQGIHV